MSSRRGVVKGNSVEDKSMSGVDQLAKGVAGVSLEPGKDDGWEVIVKKSKNKAGNSGGKQWGAQNSVPKAWGNPDTLQKLGMRNSAAGSGRGSASAWPTPHDESKRPAGRGNAKIQLSNQGYDNNPPALTAAVPPPLKNGWGWANKAPATQSSDGTSKYAQSVNPEYSQDANVDRVDDGSDDDSDVLDDSDDDFGSDGFDSDSSIKSHETRKKNNWFKDLFECMDSLTVEQINDPERQWHCPACKGGPGAIDWFKGLQPLITHAKTKGSKRVKLHRELAVLLDEELRRRGTSAIPAGEIFGKWKGLDGVEKEIVWPPMVIIMNTRHDKDENEKWIGMGNQELLDYFSTYAAVKARHSYGPQGHRGMSVLIFEASAVGYLEAERLSKNFEDNGRDRVAWERGGRSAFYSGGTRQLFGYMADKKDMDYFNQHSQGKSKMKFEMRSYQEMVVNQLKQMSEDNQLLLWFKNKIAKEQKQKKALEESFVLVSEKLRKKSEDNRIVRERTKQHHEQIEDEMYLQEQFFKDQLEAMRQSRKEKEEKFEKTREEELEKAKQSQGNPSSVDSKQGSEEIQKLIKCQNQGMEFLADREKLDKYHEEKMLELKRRLNLLRQEEIALEKEYDAELSKLMKKYAPVPSE